MPLRFVASSTKPSPLRKKSKPLFDLPHLDTSHFCASRVWTLPNTAAVPTSIASRSSIMSSSTPLFEEVVARDLLGFAFGGRSYQDQITDAVAKTKVLCGVSVERKTIGEDESKAAVDVVWVTHNFGFLGTSCRVSLVSFAPVYARAGPLRELRSSGEI